jgi:hypothetical protein
MEPTRPTIHAIMSPRRGSFWRVRPHQITTLESTSQLIDRVQAEIAAGRLWRAKEILRGNIASGRVEPEVLEQYGQLLETLGDRVEAGKYLFLSGVRAPRHGDAIDLFRHRHAKRRAADLVAQFPAGIRCRPFEILPATVQRELREWGIEPQSFRSRQSSTPVRSSWRERLAIAGWLAALAVLLVAIALGLRSIASWVWAQVS